MTKTKILPVDCVRIVVDYTDIEDLVSVCIAFGNKSNVHQLIADRKSPIHLLSQLVHKPHDLLRDMSTYNCCLTGSRVVDYFCRGSCNKNSDWNFCTTDSSNVEKMMDTLASMGVQWNEHTSASLDYYFYNSTVVNGTMSRGRGKGQRVQMKLSEHIVMMHTILALHLTTVQCIMTHWGAIHLYGKLSYQRKFIEFSNSIEHCTTLTNQINNENCEFHQAQRTLLSIDWFKDNADRYRELVQVWRMNWLLEMRLPLSSKIHDPDSFKESVKRMTHELDLPEHDKQVLLSIVDTTVNMVINDCVCIKNFALESIAKYVDRGYKKSQSIDYYLSRSCIEEVEEVCTLETSGYNYAQYTPSKGIHRNIGDNFTSVVLFKGYNTGLTDEAIDIAVGNACKFHWIEDCVGNWPKS